MNRSIVNIFAVSIALSLAVTAILAIIVNKHNAPVVNVGDVFIYDANVNSNNFDYENPYIGGFDVTDELKVIGVNRDYCQYEHRKMGRFYGNETVKDTVVMELESGKCEDLLSRYTLLRKHYVARIVREHMFIVPNN